MLDGVLYLGARCAGSWELWRTDGTAAGTRWIDTFAGTVQQIAASGRLYLTGIRGTSPDTEAVLWVSDGTAQGTTELKVFPDARLGPQHILAIEDALLFAASEENAPFPGPPQLWRSDGTVLGTKPILKVDPSEFERVGSKVFFAGDDGVHGSELWAGHTAVLLGRPLTALRDLRTDTIGGALPPEIVDGLLLRIDAATKVVERGDPRAAQGALDAFIADLDGRVGHAGGTLGSRPLRTCACSPATSATCWGRSVISPVVSLGWCRSLAMDSRDATSSPLRVRDGRGGAARNGAHPTFPLGLAAVPAWREGLPRRALDDVRLGHGDEAAR